MKSTVLEPFVAVKVRAPAEVKKGRGKTMDGRAYLEWVKATDGNSSIKRAGGK
jgi:hypothetical protein